MHLKLDTGMGRWGLSELPALGPEVVGLMTHLATADSDPVFAEQQVERFRAATEPYRELMRHVANSAAALRLPSARFDAARCGIALYGLSPFGEDPAADGLEPALSWRSYLAQVKRLEAGESTGYGRAFVAEAPTWIGIVPVGYADGFRRDLTGTEVRVSGEPRRVVGVVSMDAFAVELEQRGAGRRAGHDPRPRRPGGRSRARGGDDQLRAHLPDQLGPSPGQADGRRCLTCSTSSSPTRRPGSSAAPSATTRSTGPVVDVDVAVREPRAAARKLAKRVRRSALLALGTAWRLAGRAGGRPHGRLHAAAGADRGRPRQARLHDQRDCRARRQRGVPSTRTTASATSPPVASGRCSDGVFEDDPLRLLRAVRLEDELGFRIVPETEELIRRHADARHPAGGRADPRRAAAALGRRLPAPRRRSGCSRRSVARIDDRLDRWDSPDYRLVAVFGDELRRLPGLERAAPLRRRAAAGRAAGARTRARSTASAARRSRGRCEALAFVGASELAPAIEEARANDPAEPLLRGDELDLPPGPEIGRLLAEIEEERAAGTIATREEALDYARRHAGAVREDG